MRCGVRTDSICRFMSVQEHTQVSSARIRSLMLRHFTASLHESLMGGEQSGSNEKQTPRGV